jgi:hypothetical protein
MNVSLTAIQIEDRVPNQLSRSVIGPVTAAFYTNHTDAIDLGGKLSLDAFAHSENVWVLYQDQGVWDCSLRPEIDQLALEIPHTHVISLAEIE